MEVYGEKGALVLCFWTDMLQSRRSSECYRCAGCNPCGHAQLLVIAVHAVQMCSMLRAEFAKPVLGGAGEIWT